MLLFSGSIVEGHDSRLVVGHLAASGSPRRKAYVSVICMGYFASLIATDIYLKN